MIRFSPLLGTGSRKIANRQPPARRCSLLFGSVLLVSTLTGCGLSKAPDPEPYEVALDRSLPTFELFVEPLKFVAETDSETTRQLCPFPVSASMSGPELHARMAQHRLCEGQQQCYLVPVDYGDGTRPEYVNVGEKTIPGHLPSELSAQLFSSLAGIANIQLSENRPVVEKNPRGYVIRAALTEYRIGAEEYSGGMGIIGAGPLAILSIFSSKHTYRTGYVRLDVHIIDPRRKRVLRAFPVGGSFVDGYKSESFFSGIISEDESFQSGVLQRAQRVAMTEAARRIYQELREL